MPQMSPMWWLNMMLMFIFCLIMMNSLIYFNFFMKNKKKTNYDYKNLNWKW
uniref:ATP synthase F0 subunit 8 n=1 Tax=Onukindia connexa TaxID=3040697 RepID=UPI002551F4B0|nr:ATP synthase F0 subunit 8 [Onukindia connexa]WGC89394.1 ATP synthase F0 subunit 8 [Onukindia connexa]